MSRFLVTGGSGFFGDILKRHLLSLGHECVNIDLQPDDHSHHALKSIQGDIRDRKLLEDVFSRESIDAVFHCAAILAHDVHDKNMLWTSNVDGTRNIAEASTRHKVEKVVFTSSNCLWAKNFGRPVVEEDAPEPVEIYGRSKVEGEKILGEFQDRFNCVTIRCPTIVDAGRLGLLAILFEFIDEGRRVWVVGKGDNRYQFIYAGDLADACTRALDCSKSTTLNIGSDNVKSFAETYQYVIDRAGTGARVARLPRNLTIAAMNLASRLRISPLGPYHYKMIAEDFIFDTTRIKGELAWQPTLTNEEMLFEAYKYYRSNRKDIEGRRDVSPHRRGARKGIIHLLKWMS